MNINLLINPLKVDSSYNNDDEDNDNDDDDEDDQWGDED